MNEPKNILINTRANGHTHTHTHIHTHTHTHTRVYTFTKLLTHANEKYSDYKMQENTSDAPQPWPGKYSSGPPNR